MGAPRTHDICQPPEFTTIIANTATMIERPIKIPATKLPASRNRVIEFFMIHLACIHGVRNFETSQWVSARIAK